MSIKTTYTQRISNDTKLLAGVQTNQASFPPSVVLLGKSYTQADLVNLLQTRLKTANLALTAHAALSAAVQADRSQMAATDPVVSAFRQWLQVTNGNAPSVLSGYGLAPKKTPGQRDPETLVVAAVKARATRVARGTKGKKAKSKILGNVTGPIVLDPGTQVSAASATAAARAPAPSLPEVSITPPRA